MKYRIALILNGDRPLSTYPSVFNTAYLLNEFGYEISLFLPVGVEVDCYIENIEIVRFKRTSPAFIGILRSLHNKIKQYDLLIVFHEHELIAAGLINLIYKTPYIYFCLEIIGFDQINTIKSKIRKYLEIIFNKRALFTIVQDDHRKSMIQKMHRLNENTIFCVPNSYIGIKKRKTNYLRTKFNIPMEKVIILYAGGIESWALDSALIEAVDEWDDNYVLILHGWSRDNYLNKLRPLIEKVNRSKQRIFISNNSVNEKEYLELVSSADIGLVWYKKNIPENVKNIGLSSGKFSAFLRCGLPIIVPSYLEGIKEFIERYHFGMMAEDEFAIKDIIPCIVKEYFTYRNNAFNFYLKYLDFEKYFLPVIQEIKKIFQNP
jgi:hypothetical protein